MTSRKVSMESPKENKVPPQDQECKGPSQDHRPRTEDNVKPLDNKYCDTKISCYSKS